MGVVRRNLTGDVKKRVAFGLYVARENLREFLALAATPLGGNSGFIEEDLSSDVLGFYMYLNNKGDAREDDPTWNWLASICDFNTNRDVAISNSELVYEKYTFSTVYGWFKPKLECPTGLCKSQNWPSVFPKIVPIYSSVGGDWWKYRTAILDGALIPTNVENLYFLKKRFFDDC